MGATLNVAQLKKTLPVHPRTPFPISGTGTIGQVFNVSEYGATGTHGDDGRAIQKTIDAAVAAGGGFVFLGPGAFGTKQTIWVDSNVKIEGVGKNLSSLGGIGGVSPIIANRQSSTNGEISRITMRDFSIVGDGATSNQVGLQLSGCQLSRFDNIRVSGFTQTGGLPVQLTSWLDGATYRHTIENQFSNIETVGTNGIQVTKDASDPTTSGSNNNTFVHCRHSSFTNIGVDIDAGEGNQLFHCIATTPNTGATCIRVNDDVTGLWGCNTDCSAGAGNGTTGVLVTSGVNDTVIFQRTGNGPQFPISDSGTNTIIFRHPLTAIGGDVIVAGASTKVGFFGTTGTGKQTVSGSRGGNAALASLLTKLAGMNLITDSTSA